MIENDIRCSNKDCSGTKVLNPNSKIHQKLFSAASQMEEDVKRHILKDSPYGDQVNQMIFGYLQYNKIFVYSYPMENSIDFIIYLI